MSTACLWNRGDHTVPVTVLRTEGDDIPAGHYEAWVIPTATTEFVPVGDLVPHHTVQPNRRNDFRGEL